MTQASPITLGTTLQRVRAGPFVFTETIHAPNTTLARHSHERANIACVLHGSFTETLGGESLDCHAKSMLVKPAGESHSNTYGRTGARSLILEVDAGADRLGATASVFDRTRFISDGTFFVHVARIRRELSTSDTASPLALEGLGLELLAALTRKTKATQITPPRWLTDAREWLQCNFLEKTSLACLAETVQVHPSHLARTFRAHYGCTVGDLVRQLRLEHAASSMMDTDRSLVDIATASGFFDQSHFTRAFKLMHGLTPSEFRSSMVRNSRPRMHRSSNTSPQ